MSRMAGHDRAGRLRVYAAWLFVLPAIVVLTSLPAASFAGTSAGGLVAAYSFDEGSGTTVADASGGGNGGTVQNTTWTAQGMYTNALVFNGSDALVTVPDAPSLRLTTAMTLEAWAYPSLVNAAWRDIVFKGNDNYYLMGTSGNGGLPAGGGIFSGSYGETFGTSTLALNTWSHLALTYDGSALRLYVNGVQVASKAQTGTLATSSNPLQIGGDSIYGQYFSGRIDEVRVYNVALSAAQVQTGMNTPVGSPPSGDTTPPTAPSSLTATAASSSQINLSWTASTDNVGVTGYRVERCQGAGCSNFVQVATPAGTTYSDTGLAASTSYSYRVRASDAAGNLGPYSNTAGATTRAGSGSGPPGFVNEVVVPGITAATTIAFLPGGRMLVGELTGAIWVVQPGASQVDPVPFLQFDTSQLFGEQGLMDILPDQNFAQNGYYYIFYTRGSAGQNNHNRVSRFTALGNTTVPGSEVVLWEDDVRAAAEHHAGALAFGADGKLYFTYGDQFIPDTAQDLTSYRGKILRINKDGTVPTDNPFYDGNGPNKDAVWALGVRNPYRMSIDPVTGRMYMGDVGGNVPSIAVEEVNVGIAGANYGWPLCEGTCGVAGTTNPIYSYPHAGRDAAITGGFVYRGSQFPSEFVGSYFFGDYVQNWIKRLRLDANGNVLGVENFWPADGTPDTPEVGDPVKFIEGPEGSLYYVDIGFNDLHIPNPAAIRRIRYAAGNLPPVAVASATPTSGQAPLTVTFSSAGSSDPEGAPLSYTWTFGDGATSTAANPTHTYAAGQYVARLAVSDGSSTTLSSDITIRAGNPPTPTILTPTTGALFRAGDTIAYTGSAIDPEDGDLPASAFSWTILFHHDSHVHPAGGPFTNTKSGTLQIPASGHDFQGATNYEIVLTVTDSTGLTSSASVTIVPHKVNLTFDTIPSGLTVEIDGIPRSTPFVLDDLKGFQHTLNAPNQSSGGTSYTFASWSDGGAQSHGIVVPDVDGSFVATFQASDGQPPTAPSNLAASPSGSNRINLSWTASTDNVGVTGYRVERCQSAGCSSFTQVATPTGTSYADTGLVAGTSYSYRVRAADAAGNLSTYSNVAGATTEGLVAAYGFSEGSGATLADASGAGNVGSVQGAAWATQGKFGNALSFNGTSAYVNVPDAPSLDLTTRMTLEAWVNPSSVSRAWREVIYKGSNNYYLESTTDRKPAVPAGGGTIGSSNVRLLGTTVLPLNTWAHLAVTYDGATIRLYVNGVQVSSRARTGNILTSTNSLRIGSTGSGRYFQGLVDEVRVYNVALTAAQIQSDMSTPITTPFFAGLGLPVLGSPFLSWVASVGSSTTAVICCTAWRSTQYWSPSPRSKTRTVFQRIAMSVRTSLPPLEARHAST